MINAQELRIGSIIYFPFIGGNVEVIGLAVKDDNRLFIQTRLNNNTFFELPEKYNPIPLTEEWMIRLGFKRFCKDFALKGIIIHTRKRGFVLRKSVPIIKHVHQLQLLYFALTNEELEIK